MMCLWKCIPCSYTGVSPGAAISEDEELGCGEELTTGLLHKCSITRHLNCLTKQGAEEGGKERGEEAVAEGRAGVRG